MLVSVTAAAAYTITTPLLVEPDCCPPPAVAGVGSGGGSSLDKSDIANDLFATQNGGSCIIIMRGLITHSGSCVARGDIVHSYFIFGCSCNVLVR
jgi:hypothetical protein